MNRIILIIIILTLAIGGYFLWISKSKNFPDANIIIPVENGQEESDMEIADSTEISVKEIILRDSSAKIGELQDVSGGNSSGKAYLLRGEKMLYHYVEANLPDPQEGNDYEGWLVKKTPSLDFFSTGLMEKGPDGSYTLSYASGKLSEGFDSVVITEETIIDEIPEKHIIEGDVE